MSLSNSDKLLNSLFYEADVFNIGAKSKNKAGRASELTTYSWYFIYR
ncbi:hypothetical protein [Catenibacterium sp.]